MRPSPIDSACRRHPLVEVAARTGILVARLAGSVTVHCPLPSHGHPDRTPSLRLYLNDGHYYCFGCGARGDVVQWVQETEGVGVGAAIRMLDSGVPLTNAWASHPGSRIEPPPVTIGERSEPVSQAEAPVLARTPPRRVYAALAAAWGYYTCGPLHSRAVEYLAARGLDVEVLETHTGRAEAGHTPAKADGLVAALRARGFSDGELIDAGLAHRRLGGGPVSDFYRQRVLIPVRDDQKRIVGMIGRNVGDQHRWAKYKNPPRTHAYDKAVNLYQPLSAPVVGRHSQVVVVEGTLDAMAIAIAAIRTGQAERFCPLTQSGRELSPTQMERVIGLHPSTPVLGLDGDPAGQESACRHAMSAATQGRALAVTVLPDGHDPASWLAEQGGEGIRAWVHDRTFDAARRSPKPVPAPSFVVAYLAHSAGTRTERMERIVGAAALGEKHLRGRSAYLWVSRMAADAGALAVAEAHQHAVAHADPVEQAERPPAAECRYWDQWRPEPPPATTDVGFETAAGPGGVDALIQRVAAWGRRLPQVGDRAFVRSAAEVIDDAGIALGRHAAQRLERALDRTACSVEPPGGASGSAPTTDTRAMGL